MKSWKILIVDDDVAVSRILVLIFQRAGYEVLTAPNGLVALEHMRTQERRFDALISDIQMPKMNGRELVNHLADSGPYLPECTFIATSRTEDSERGWVSEFSNVRLVEKPVSPKQLLRLVSEHLATLDQGPENIETRDVA